jgi:mono/diheme cytochrome c family protein
LIRLALIGCAIGLAIAVAVAYSIGSHKPEAQLTDQQEYGRSLYNGNCAACHEQNQLDLKKVPPNLHSIFAFGRLPSGGPATDDEVRLVITKGKNTMPSFDQRLTPDEVAAIIAYLHTGVK